MLNQARWEAECILMHKNFPQFTPFYENGMVGFQGYLRGPRSGRLFEVVVQVQKQEYPSREPGVYMNPHPETHHWILDNRLCYRRQERQWKPGRSTFANILLIAVDYVSDFA